jgi:hypothetical protein
MLISYQAAFTAKVECSYGGLQNIGLSYCLNIQTPKRPNVLPWPEILIKFLNLT